MGLPDAEETAKACRTKACLTVNVCLTVKACTAVEERRFQRRVSGLMMMGL